MNNELPKQYSFSFMEGEGGFPDNIFIFPPSEDLKCPVCLLIMRDPHIMLCCADATLCYSCSTSRKTCPVCEEECSDDPDERSTLDKQTRKEILELTVKCISVDKDCDWTGELYDLKDHLEKTCPKIDEKKRLREAAKTHLKDKILDAKKLFEKERNNMRKSRENNMASSCIRSAIDGDWANVFRLLKLGVSPDTKNNDKSCTSLLHYACSKKGSIEAVNEMLSLQANPNAKDRRQVTPLHLAVRNGFCQAVQLLIKNGADINLVDTDRQSALHIACIKGHWDIVDVLLQQNCETDLLDRRQNTALINACIKGYTNIVMSLLEYGADTTLSEMYQMTPLHIAAAGGHTDIVEILLDHEVLPNELDVDGHTALNLAIIRGHTETAKTILLFCDKAGGIRKDPNEMLPDSSPWVCSTLLLATVLNNESVKDELIYCGVKQAEFNEFKLFDGWEAYWNGINHRLSYRNTKTGDEMDEHPRVLEEKLDIQ